MDWIVIENVKPYDGRYAFDVPNFDPTMREWGWIKRLSGYMPLTLDVGLAGGDAELIVVLAVIAMHRNGKITAADVEHVHGRFLDVEFGSAIRLELGADDDAEDPTQAFPEKNAPASAPTFGDASTTSSEESVPHLRPTGTHGSDISGSA